MKPGKYRHYKGREYELLCTAVHSETLEPMAVYRALYGDLYRKRHSQKVYIYRLEV